MNVIEAIGNLTTIAEEMEKNLKRQDKEIEALKSRVSFAYWGVAGLSVLVAFMAATLD